MSQTESRFLLFEIENTLTDIKCIHAGGWKEIIRLKMERVQLLKSRKKNFNIERQEKDI